MIFVIIFGAVVTAGAGLIGYFIRWQEEIDSSAESDPSLEPNV